MHVGYDTCVQCVCVRVRVTALWQCNTNDNHKKTERCRCIRMGM